MTPSDPTGPGIGSERPDLRYLARDRRREWLGGAPVPDHAIGALLFADVSGFTALSQRLMQTLGSQRGAEEITRLLNALYEPLIATIHEQGGEVVTFGGDSLTCWFADDSGLRAVACGLALQAKMERQHPTAEMASLTAPLSLRVAIAHGPASRLRVGNPAYQYFDVLAGAPLDRLTRTEQQTDPGEVCLDMPLAHALAVHLHGAPLASAPDTFRVMALRGSVPLPPASTGALEPLTAPTPTTVAPWLPLAVSERLQVEDETLLAETRPVAVLFLSFEGLAYNEERDAGAKLDQFVRWVQETLSAYESSVLHVAAGDKGSHLYAAFGAPLAHDDDPQRALEAALLLQRLPAELSFVRSLRMGLNWGQVRAGIYGSSTRRTYGLLGDTMNLAARLMSAAPPGAILVGPALARLAPPHYRLVPLGTLALKGMFAGVVIHQLVGEQSPQPSDQNPSLGGGAAPTQPRLVGRAREQAHLLALLEAHQAGQAHTVIVEGEAGLGKSRLVQELVREGEQRGFVSVVGRGRRVGAAPYAAWQPIMRTLLALSSTDPVAIQQAKVHQTLAARAPHLLERAALLSPLLGFALPETALTRELGGGVRQQALQALVGELLRVTLACSPLLLVLEDAQWLDDLSRALALSVARSVAAESLPLLLLLVTRPIEEGDPSQAEWESMRALPTSSRLSLHPLGEEVPAVAAAILGIPNQTLPPALATLLQLRAGGNPLVIEALLAMLIEQGQVQVGSQGEHPTIWVADSLTDSHQAFPETLYGLVLARLDRLTAAQQAILRVASVLGSGEDIRALHEALSLMARLAPAQITHGLDDLVRLKLLALEEGQEGRYTFTQPLIQEVVYHTLLFEQRHTLHRAVAAWYEVTYQGEERLEPYYARLAYHYQAAEEREGERHYARLAGEQAAKLFANRVALQHLTRALALTPAEAMTDQYALLTTRERVHEVMGDRAAQWADLQGLTRLAIRLRQPVYRTYTLVRRAQYALVMGDPYLVREALQELTLLNDRSLQAGEDTVGDLTQGYIIWGHLLAQQGEYAEAAQRLQQALSWAKTITQAGAQIDACLALGILAEKVGQPQEAENYYLQARQLAEDQQDARRAGQAWLRLGQRAYQQAQYEEARRYYQEALSRTRAVGDVQTEGRALIELAWVSVDQSEYAPARSYLRQALSLCRSLHDQEGEILALRCSAYQAFAYGMYARALRHTQAVRSLAESLGRQDDVAWSLENLGLLAHYQGHPEQARTWATQSLALARAIGSPRRQGFALTLLGHALLALGELEGAEAAYREACTLRARLQERDLLAESQTGLAAVALRKGEPEQALLYVEPLLQELAHSPFYGADDACQIFLVCYDVLLALGDERASSLLEQSYHLVQARATSLPEPHLRQIYWMTVPTHRRLWLLSQQTGLEPGAHPSRSGRDLHHAPPVALDKGSHVQVG